MTLLRRPTRPDRAADLARLIKTKRARVGVIGLGYVGLPVASLFARRGFRVIGFDIDRRKIRELRAGRSYIGEVAPQSLRRRFEATDNFARLSEPDAIVICVPTPIREDREPDLSYVEKTAKQIGKAARPGQLIVLESSTYPGTTREIIAPAVAHVGDVFVGYAPERLDPGNPRYRVDTIPRLVSGMDAASAKLVELLYRSAGLKVKRVASCEVAEAAKLLENIYRAVNIALVNELKMILDKMGIDVWDVVTAAATKPFGYQAFWPGPGMGGHCIPVDPFYLAWKARQVNAPARFIELAGEVNVQMPHYVVSRLAKRLAIRGARVLILGVAYKPDTDDPRESPALKIMELLKERGARVEYHDPHIPALRPMRRYKLGVKSVALTPSSIRRADAVILVTAHGAFKPSVILKHAKLIVDTRHVFPDAPNVIRA